jgi:hypothetical protein
LYRESLKSCHRVMVTCAFGRNTSRVRGGTGAV